MTSQQRFTHITQPERVTPGPGYSHVVTGSGQLVAVSGQVPIGENGQLAGLAIRPCWPARCLRTSGARER
jgi:hypothetical protein